MHFSLFLQLSSNINILLCKCYINRAVDFLSVQPPGFGWDVICASRSLSSTCCFLFMSSIRLSVNGSKAWSFILPIVGLHTRAVHVDWDYMRVCNTNEFKWFLTYWPITSLSDVSTRFCFFPGSNMIDSCWSIIYYLLYFNPTLLSLSDPNSVHVHNCTKMKECLSEGRPLHHPITSCTCFFLQLAMFSGSHSLWNSAVQVFLCEAPDFLLLNHSTVVTSHNVYCAYLVPSIYCSLHIHVLLFMCVAVQCKQLSVQYM